MQSTASINLIKHKVNIIEELTKWALNVGRFLIIIVEILAFGTFVWRFTIDRQLIDLHDQIEKKQNLIASLEQNEQKYRTLQERLLITKTATNQGQENAKILKDIIKITPPGITFNSINISDKSLTITSNVPSAALLTNFIKNLREYPQISSVNIDRIDNKQGSINIGVALTAQLK